MGFTVLRHPWFQEWMESIKVVAKKMPRNIWKGKPGPVCFSDCWVTQKTELSKQDVLWVLADYDKGSLGLFRRMVWGEILASCSNYSLVPWHSPHLLHSLPADELTLNPHARQLFWTLLSSLGDQRLIQIHRLVGEDEICPLSPVPSASTFPLVHLDSSISCHPLQTLSPLKRAR